MQERYSRQILFAGVGEEGQRKIREKHVLIIGAGALVRQMQKRLLEQVLEK